MKNIGLILSGIGGIIYFLTGIMLLCFLLPIRILPLSLVITGEISLMGTIMGTIIGKNEKKIDGVVILISIPISIVFTLILNNIFGFIPYSISYDIVLYVLVPIPYPHSVFVIIGGILCLMSSDN